MSFSTNIKFSNELIENKTCTITYSGFLFQNNSDSVSIVYGFGNEWNHTSEQKMEKTNEGFVAEVNMLNYDSFNFCFKNANNEWDNNNYQNYGSPISKQEPEEINFIINDESVITNILNNLFEVDLSEIQDTKPIKTVETLSNVEIAQSNIEEAKVEEVPSIENTPFDIEIEENIPVNIEDSLVNVTEAESLDQDIENIFNDIYQGITVENKNGVSEEENIQNVSVEKSEFNMNNLIDEILSPIVKSSLFEEEEEKEILENYSSTQNDSTNFFEDFDDLDLDNKIDNLIADLFNNTKAFAEKTNTQTAESNVFKVEEIDNAIDDKIEEILSKTPVTEEIKNTVSTDSEQYLEESNIEAVQNVEEQQNLQTIENTVSSQETKSVQPTPKVPDFTVIEDDDEESLLESRNHTLEENQTTALVEVSDGNKFIVSPRSLGKFYMFKKKVKLAFTKLFVSIPKMLKRGFNTENN